MPEAGNLGQGGATAGFELCGTLWIGFGFWRQGIVEPGGEIGPAVGMEFYPWEVFRRAEVFDLAFMVFGGGTLGIFVQGVPYGGDQALRFRRLGFGSGGMVFWERGAQGSGIGEKWFER